MSSGWRVEGSRDEIVIDSDEYRQDKIDNNIISDSS